jgi:hypothetical protein
MIIIIIIIIIIIAVIRISKQSCLTFCVVLGQSNDGTNNTKFEFEIHILN